MQFFINLTAILKLSETCDTLVAVNPATFEIVKPLWPQHCYGGSETTAIAVSALHPYRVDIVGLILPVLKRQNQYTENIEATYQREVVAVTREQWLAIVEKPEFREFCFGGESKTDIAKKEWMTYAAPNSYELWKGELLSLLEATAPFDSKANVQGRGLTEQAIEDVRALDGLILADTREFSHRITAAGLSLQQHTTCLEFAIKRGVVEKIQTCGLTYFKVDVANL